jgi:hypothetical protein
MMPFQRMIVVVMMKMMMMMGECDDESEGQRMIICKVSAIEQRSFETASNLGLMRSTIR